MAGAGLKAFTSTVLTAAEVNTYLMQQSVMVFASDAARTTAFTNAGITVADGMLSWRTDDDVLEIYENAGWRVITGSKSATYPNQIAITTGSVTRPLPYAIQTGQVSGTTSAAGSLSVSVTLLANRFSVAPVITMSHYRTGAATTIVYGMTAASVLATGFTFYFLQVSGTAAALAITGNWTAIQMTSTTAAG